MRMKFDFVTNSSSASFIIGDLNGESEEFVVSMNIEVNLKDFIREIIKSLDELNHHWIDWYDSIEGDSERYKKCKSIVEKGGVVYILSVDSVSDNPLEAFLCEHGLEDIKLPDNIIVIEGGGGY